MAKQKKKPLNSQGSIFCTLSLSIKLKDKLVEHPPQNSPALLTKTGKIPFCFIILPPYTGF